MLTIEALNEYGANTKEGLERCLNDEGFYLSLVPAALEKKDYERIEIAVQSGNFEEAFEAAHALKGVLGNLALTPIYTPVSEMTERLRARDTTFDYGASIKSMWDARNKLEQLMS